MCSIPSSYPASHCPRITSISLRKAQDVLGLPCREENQCPPQVHQSVDKGGISTVILACLLIWHVGCRASAEAVFGQAKLSVHSMLPGPDRDFRELLSILSPRSSAAGTFELSSGLCRQSW